MRMAQQICGDLADGGVLKVLRLGNRWDLAFHQSLKRDAKGDVVEFDIDPRLIEQFGDRSLRKVDPQVHMDQGHQFVLVAAPDARPYVRMVPERLFPTLPVLSHVEIARGVADQVARHHLVIAASAGHACWWSFLLFCRIGGCLMLMPGFSSVTRAGPGAPVRRARHDVCADAAPDRRPETSHGQRGAADARAADLFRDRDRHPDRR